MTGILRGFFHRLRVLLRGEQYARDVDEEIRFHLSLETAQQAHAGSGAAAAAVAARRQFGNPTFIAEEVRYASGTRHIDAIAQDVRYALRSLRRAPAFAMLAIATLAIAIGSSTAVFSVVDAIVLRGLPYRDADRLHAIYEVNDQGNPRTPSYPTFEDWKTQSASFSDAVEGLAFIRGDGILIDESPERHITAYVSREFFDVAGTRPVLGRTFAPDEQAAGAPGVAVISWALFMEKFGGDRSIVGRTMRVNSEPVTIVGVMPHAFALPNFGGGAWLMPALWQPLEPHRGSMPQLALRGLHVDSRTLVRLRAGADSARVATAMRTVQQRLAAEYPVEQAHWTSVALEPVSQQVYGTRRQQLTMVFGAVALVLFLACVNISNLFLVRASMRSRELAVRAALGASRLRIARQLFSESLVIALAAAVVGLALAVALVGVARGSASQLLPFTDALTVRGRPVAFAFATALIAAVIMGALPAIRASLGAFIMRLRSGGGLAGGDRQDRRIRHALVATQFALTVTLLIGAGLLLQSFRRVASVSMGFEAKGLVSFSIRPPSPRYDSPDAAAALYRRILDRVQATPGVSEAAAAGGALIPVPVRQANDDRDDSSIRAAYHPVSAEYLRAMGIPLVAGRWFGDEDMRVASGFVVNEALAQRLAPRSSALGVRISVPRSSQARQNFGELITLPVIGVAGNARLNGPESVPGPEVLLPYTLEVWPWMRFSVRAGAAVSEQLLRAIESAVREVDSAIEWQGKPAVVPAGIAAVDAGRRFITMVLAGFALAALVLACVGLYGIVAYGVEQRRRELGVRIALGASNAKLVGSVISDAVFSMAAGIALGALGSWFSVRLIRGMLFETTFADPGTIAGVVVVLSGVTLLASYQPALRATRTDPMLAIRSD